MPAAAVAQILIQFLGMVPAAIQAGAEFRDQMSETDQAAFDAKLEAIVAAEGLSFTKATDALDRAAKE